MGHGAFSVRVRRIGVQEMLSFLQEASVPAPLLEALRLNFGPMYDPPAASLEFLQPFCGITPQLRTIDSNVYIPMGSPIYRGLTRLHLSYINYPEPDPIRQLLGILGLCLLLESLCFVHLVLLPTIPTAHASDPIITLCHLQKLHIVEWDARWVPSHFLPRIIPDLRSVRALYMRSSETDSGHNTSARGKLLVGGLDAFKFTIKSPWMSTSAEVAISRSQCRNLDPASALESFFRVHLTIKTVALNVYWPWDEIFGLFVVTPTKQLCPLLEDLYIASPQELDERTLLEAVKSRAVPAVDSPHLRGVTALRHLFFGLRYDRPSPSALSALQSYVTVDFKEGRYCS
ncbi:hypothetical protein BOTBODRAFT_178989 [Botryobasidium botryosum FD-172 SS1]|uniref:F-box domain-containing protein n=1 Tax=Botryobasidium botryosum (strain FD-172 SS1) TaxID=930990 RepID=A0A067M411_BOTB1|nr:hypothetical protein BOTBODRAFT_178989 [Botryobasidium botryosum FD-172 SS1]